MGNPTVPTSERLRWLLFWVGWWTAFGVFDYWRNCKHDGSTFSEVIRDVFHTDTGRGSRAFSVILGYAKDVFEAHILKQPFR